MTIPLIDVASLERGDPSQREHLRAAACETGAFAVAGHAVAPQLREALRVACDRFFDLPQSERDAIDMIHSPFFRGYSAVGSERTQGLPDRREQLDVGPEEPARAAASDPPYLRLHGPNLWPATLPELRPAVLSWMAELRGVSLRLLDALGAALGREPGALTSGATIEPHERLKIIRYPAGAGAQEEQGVGEHSDSGVITLIAHDGMPGLQVLAGGAFSGVVAPRGALIAVLGRALTERTGGATRAAVHRVSIAPGSAARVSVAYFLNPRLDYAGYGEEALRVVLRSHPETAKRYFSDLLAGR